MKRKSLDKMRPLAARALFLLLLAPMTQAEAGPKTSFVASPSAVAGAGDASRLNDATVPRYGAGGLVNEVKRHGHGGVPQAPADFESLIVFLANGELPESEPQALVGDLSFFDDVMGWDAVTLDDWRREKLEGLVERVGIEDATNHPDLQVLMGTTNPDLGYRAVSFSGRRVPASGWRVREGFLIAVVTNPEGVTLGGRLEGMQVPVGTIVGGGGLYNVEVTDRRGRVTGEEIVFDFTTSLPIQAVVGGASAFICEIESERFGAGIGQGIFSSVPIGGGRVKANFRNVITFSTRNRL